jgi:hypothetical protein
MKTSDFNGSNTPSSLALMPSAQDELVASSLDWTPACNSTATHGLYFGIVRPNVRQRCVEAFYQYFYDAHPFLPPRLHLLQSFKTNPTEHLQTAICYVGSRYVHGASTPSFALDFKSYLTGDKPTPKDASMVQAMLLFALGLDGNNDRKEAIEILTKARNLAVELGMNQREYAVVAGQGQPIYEESLRRTWWEIYVVSVVIAGFHGTGAFHHVDTSSNLPLPCEEKDFASGVCLDLDLGSE